MPIRLSRLAVLFLVTVLLSACSSGPVVTGSSGTTSPSTSSESTSAPDRPGPGYDSVQDEYRTAVRDAMQADPSEVVRSLVPILQVHERLQWRTHPQHGEQVLVVTFQSWYDSYTTGESIAPRDTTPIWVTAAPEVKSFCRNTGLSDADRRMKRLYQYLGLRPDFEAGTSLRDRYPVRGFIEFWVSPDALARPCPDPDVSDRACDLEFPGPPSLVRVSPSHYAWFTQNWETTYRNGTVEGYPWTRLGYTYDWGNPGSDVGASEFLFRAGHEGDVAGVYSATDYCAR